MPLYLKPASKIKADLGLQTGGPVHAFFTDTCYKHMNEYTPKRIGNLRKNVDLSDPRYIVYESIPYAEIQYHGIIWGHKVPKENYTTPGTGPYWDKRMWSVEKQDIIKEVQDFLDRGV